MTIRLSVNDWPDMRSFRAAQEIVNKLNSLEILVNSGSASSGGHTIEDEGVPLTQRTNMNFTGAGVTTTDAGGKTVVTIPAGGSVTNNYLNQLLLGEEGESPFFVPGAQGSPGAAGAVGAQGAPGVPVMPLDAEPQEPMMIPGNPGQQGMQGFPAITMLLDPEQPELPMMIPGAPGVPGNAGSAGAQGSPGLPIFLLGESGEDGSIGPPGPAGAAGGGGAPGGQTTEVQFNNGGAFEGADKLTFASSTAGAAFGAGSAAAGSWPTLGSGTLLTTAEAGAIERDANCLYACTDTANRGVIPVVHIARANATRTFTSNTAQQAIFNSPTTLTLETGCYFFDALIAMTAMSATSGNGKFSIIGAGTATLAAILWQAWGNDVAAEGTAGATGGGWHIIATQTAANVSTAATGTALCFAVRGTFEVSVAGTIIPSFAQTTAAAAIISIGSYFRVYRVGSESLTNVGQWT